MPERRRARSALALAAGVLVLAVGAPAALAQPAPPAPELEADDRWSASELTEPAVEPGDVIRVQPLTVAGTLVYEKLGPADHITQAEVRVVDDPSDRTDLRDGCTLPDPVVVPGPGPEPRTTSELALRVDTIEVPCNGRYLVEIEATLDDPDAPTFTLRRPVVLGVLPPAVTGVQVRLDDAARRVTATFDPVPADQLPPDAIGYVLERGGPATPEGEIGRFVDVGAIDLGDEPRIVDDLSTAAAGTYTYRVRATRAGADGPERSSVLDTGSQTVTIGEPPAAPPRSQATVRNGPRRGSVSISRRSTTVPRRSTATTIDTGFEGTIDYGDRPDAPEPSLPDGGDEPLAGQSIIQDEGDGGVDLAAPVAGALVLLGWAGHLAYLNRLAKQL